MTVNGGNPSRCDDGEPATEVLGAGLGRACIEEGSGR
jgi:hypothetical protein